LKHTLSLNKRTRTGLAAKNFKPCWKANARKRIILNGQRKFVFLALFLQSNFTTTMKSLLIHSALFLIGLAPLEVVLAQGEFPVCEACGAYPAAKSCQLQDLRMRSQHP
jgi:hypothetical protein